MSDAIDSIDPEEMTVRQLVDEVRRSRGTPVQPMESIPPKYSIVIMYPNAGYLMPCAFASSHGASFKHRVSVFPLQFGDIEHNFNMMLCSSYSERKDKELTHIAMAHSDIGAQSGWLDVLLEEMDRLDADIMTTVLPIKDERGLTTTGIRYPEVWGTRRLTMHEIARLPETFSIDDTDEPRGTLAINTGLWVARFDERSRIPWHRFEGFHPKHKIDWSDPENPQAWFDSEDWLFSDWLAKEGIKAYATRKPVAFHRGGQDFGNQGTWGTWDRELQRPQRPVDERISTLPKPNLTIETEHPVAVDSLDHTQPLGTALDNFFSLAFNRKLYELIPAKEVRLLDLGCAGGGLVRSILEDGGFAVGVEGSDFSKERQRAEWATIPEWLFTADVTEPFAIKNCATADPLKFNVITGWEFFEHIAEDKLEALWANILKHATNDAILIGTISPREEPHHVTAKPKNWWIDKMAEASLQADCEHVMWVGHAPEIEEHFGTDLVRQIAQGNTGSFAFGMRIVEGGGRFSNRISNAIKASAFARSKA
jgi:2-polyprenyl-3-methyl-5-hydroxy-6-metoxy-1,4-benzoquinol methylase